MNYEMIERLLHLGVSKVIENLKDLDPIKETVTPELLKDAAEKLKENNQQKIIPINEVAFGELDVKKTLKKTVKKESSKTKEEQEARKKAYNKTYYNKNKEKIKSYIKDYYKNLSPEQKKEFNKKNYERAKERKEKQKKELEKEKMNILKSLFNLYK